MRRKESSKIELRFVGQPGYGGLLATCFHSWTLQFGIEGGIEEEERSVIGYEPVRTSLASKSLPGICSTSYPE